MTEPCTEQYVRSRRYRDSLALAEEAWERAPSDPQVLFALAAATEMNPAGTSATLSRAATVYLASARCLAFGAAMLDPRETTRGGAEQEEEMADSDAC